MKLRLRHGATVEAAINLLDLLAVNAYGEAMPAGPSHPADKRDAYVRWASSAEQQLVGVLDRSLVLGIFENPRHRDICAMPPGNQLMMLISSEVEAKSAQLRDMALELKEARARMTQSPGYPTLIDTNLLLECLRPDQINWASILGEPVRLMLPLRVVEELDAKKYDAKDRLRQISRQVLPWLEGLFAGPGSGPVSLGGPDGTTIEVLLADRPRYRPDDADEEVLESYHEVRLLAGRAALVTADTGMRLRARAEGIDVFSMPSKYDRLSEKE